MKKVSKILIISLVLVLSGSLSVWAGEVTGLIEFKAKDPALASEVNDNFNAVKAAVDDNDAAITSNYNEITKNASDIDALGVQPGVAWTEVDSAVAISNTAAAIRSLMLNAPDAGYAIVTASGYVYWNISSAAQGMVRLKISESSKDIDEAGGGTQFIRFQSGLGTGVFDFPFSTTRVFPVTKGVNTFYFNAWHQVVNGSPSVSALNFSAIYVPANYTYSTIVKPPIIIDPRF
jgi:hypothetical protein